MRPSLVAWLCLVAALVLAAASVRVHADDAMMASAVEASVAAAIAADAGADAEHAVDAAALAEVDAAADAEAEAERKKKKKNAKAKSKAKAKAKSKKRRYVGGDIMFNRAMSVRGVMAAGSLIANNATVQGTLIARQLKAKRVRAHTLSVGELKTTRLSSPTGTIVIEGDLLITHSRTLEFPKKKANATKLAKKGGKKGAKHAAAAKSAGKAAKGMSFLAEEVVVGGVKQWALVRHDHFEHHNADGWHLVGSNEAVATSACSAGGDHFLGGHCELANGPARKAYTHLPPHTQVRITARYHFIDNWRGETAFAAIGDDYVWTQTHHITGAQGRAAGLQLCGSEAYPETRLSAPIDVSVPHTDSTLTLSFGARSAHSSATASLAEERAIACERSFGVDDVAVYIR